MHEGLVFFIIFLANKVFKSFLPKESLLDTTTLLISTFFTEIGLLC